MRTFAKWARMVTAGLGVALAGTATAIPSAENYADVSSLGDASKGATKIDNSPLFLQDNVNPNIYYAPYDQVFVTPVGAGDGPEGRPQFGLTYDEQGGLLSFAIRAGWSQARLQAIHALKADNDNVKVSPLMAISGFWNLTMKSSNGDVFLGAPDNVNTVDPGTQVAMSVLIGPKALKYIVTAYQTGASLGVNYNYTFRAVLTPLRLRASIHWTSFQEFLQNETKIMTHAELAVHGGCGFLCHFDSKSSITDVDQVRNVVRTAIERQIIKIDIISGGGDQSETDRDNRLIDEVTKVIMAKTFKPMDTKWQPLPITDPHAECTADAGGLLGFGASFCFARATSYLHNDETTWEDRYYEYDITSQGIANLPGAVGSSFSYMCKDHPELFINVRTGATGCPTKWDEGGIKTEGEPGAPAAKMPATPIAAKKPDLGPPADD